MDNIDIEIHDLIDLLSFTLSNEFIEKWRYKYGNKLLKLFQLRIINALKNSKNLKLKSIYKYLSKDSGYSSDIVKNFLLDVDYEIYFPIITGCMRDIEAKDDF